MIRALGSLLAMVLAMPTSAQTTQADLVSPCPSVFTYEPPGTEAGKWYGVVNLTTDSTLYALWLNIVLESKADILGNWVGEVTTDDNMDFKIENTKMKIDPGPPLSIRFFIQYNAEKPIPKLKAIRFNGREICNIESPQVIERETPVRSVISYEDQVSRDVTTSTTVRPTVPTTSRIYDRKQTTSQTQYWHQTEKPQTTSKAPYWITKADNRQTTTVKPYWTEAVTVSTIRTTPKPQYWQQTTSKSQYWTQQNSEDKKQTTVRPQGWSYTKVGNQQVTTTTQPTAQVWSQTTRTEVKPHTTTEKSSVSKVQTWTQDNKLNQTNSKSRTEKPTRNEINHHTTEKAPVWPNVKVTDNQQVSSKNNKSHTEVKQVVQTQYWPKIAAEIVMGTVEKLPSKTESTSYVWPETKKSDSTQDYIRPTERPVYVRPEDRQTVSEVSYDTRPRDNLQSKPNTWSGSENTQNTKQKTSEVQHENRNEGGLEARPIKRTGDNNGEKQSWSGERTSSWAGDSSQSWADQNKNRMDFQSGVESSGYTAGDSRIRNLDESELPFHKYQLTTELPPPAVFNTPNSEEYDAPKKEDKVEYYVGGLPIFYIPYHGPQSTGEPECGKVLLNKDKDRNRKASSTLEGQWPWQVALYQQQTSVDFRYICGGTLVTKRHVITAAHCVTKKASTRVVNKNTLTVYLGKHNLRNSVEGVQVKFVGRILIYPEYNASNFRSDLAILELRDAVTYSDRVQPACLWPEHETDLKHVVGQKGSVVGWGYEVTGVARQELSLLEMPVVDQQTCINSYEDFYGRFTSDKTFCAGYRNSGSACNGDSGGGMVFEKGDSWYLRGVVSLSVAKHGEYRCDPSHYVIFTDVAKFLPWILDNIEEDY